MSYKVITIAQQKGGTGKTTIAAHLAVAFRQAKYRVALIDLDPQACLAKWCDMYNQRLLEESKKKLLSCSTVSGWQLHNEIENIKNVDLVIIDTPANMETEMLTAMKEADIVITPVQSPTEIDALEATINVAQRARAPHRIVLNRVIPQSNGAEEFDERFANVLSTKLHNRVNYSSAMAEGKTILSESGPGADEIRALQGELACLIMAKVRYSMAS